MGWELNVFMNAEEKYFIRKKRILKNVYRKIWKIV